MVEVNRQFEIPGVAQIVEGNGGLPKVRVHRIVVKKAKKAKEEEKPAAEGEEAAAPAAEKK